ncbi:unnamed protein product [Alopecurus aequalis]
MAHWSRASSSTYGKSCSPLENANNSTCTQDSGEFKRSSVTERLMLGGNYAGISMENVQHLNMSGAGGDVWQETEQKRIERRYGSFQSSMMQMQRDENFYTKTVVSETLSVRRLPDLPLDFQQLVNSKDNLDSHWNQIPMLSINQKFDGILNPRLRSAAGTVFDDLFVPQQAPELNVAPSNLMGFSYQEYELQSHRRTDRIMDHCKPAGGIIRLREDSTGLTSDPAGKRLKFDDNNSLSDCLIDKHGTCHYFANSNQEPLWKCSEKMFNLSENNDEGQSVGGASHYQKSRTPAGLHERQPLVKFADSSEEKSPYLFEMLTTPSNLQSPYSTDSLYSGIPSGFGVCAIRPNIDSHLVGDKKQFSPKTEKYVSAGISSSLAQKDNGCAEEAKEHLATLSINGSPGRNEESRLPNVNQDISSKEDFCTDPSHRWLKRLCHDVAGPGSKRPKIGDCSPAGGASGTDIEKDHVAARSVHCWLGRLCKGGRVAPVSHEGRHQRMQKPDAPARELRGHFPSIKAMAMMGRVMSKVRPLDRQRKGPCVMWKTEGA